MYVSMRRDIFCIADRSNYCGYFMCIKILILFNWMFLEVYKYKMYFKIIKQTVNSNTLYRKLDNFIY